MLMTYTEFLAVIIHAVWLQQIDVNGNRIVFEYFILYGVLVMSNKGHSRSIGHTRYRTTYGAQIEMHVFICEFIHDSSRALPTSLYRFP